MATENRTSAWVGRTGDVIGLGAQTAPESISATATAAGVAAGSIGYVAKAAVVGGVRGSSEAGVETLEAISRTSRSAVTEASAVGADITTAAVGAVEGAIEIAKETSVSVEAAAAAAATRVRNAVQGTIRGVKVILKTPFE